MVQVDKQTLADYLSWALDADIEPENWSEFSGGVHQNLRVSCQVNAQRECFLVRLTPSVNRFGFARNEVVPYDLEAEFKSLRDLESVELSTPKVWGFDSESHFFHRPAFVMEYIEGPTVLEASDTAPDEVSHLFAETIWRMNQVTPSQVPNVAGSSEPSDPLRWVRGQLSSLETPRFVAEAFEFLEQESPTELPCKAFGNGDLGPKNFIRNPEGSIAIVDWEYVGFNDPVLELMLLHTWPEDGPFLGRFPIDEIYCDLAGIDAKVLPWYEILADVNGWIFAAKDGNQKRTDLHRTRLLTSV